MKDTTLKMGQSAIRKQQTGFNVKNMTYNKLDSYNCFSFNYSRVAQKVDYFWNESALFTITL